jgi:lipopolysaccharide export system protein LptC
MTAPTQSLAARHDLYQRLVWRNRVVGVLRLVVPAAGVLLASVFAIQLYIGGLARDFSVGGVSIDRDNLVVSSPHYSGVTRDGGRYDVVAETARVAIADAEVVEMFAPVLTLKRAAAAPEMTATAEIASFHAGAQTVEVPGETAVSDTEGMNGRLEQMRVDFVGETIVARGPVTLTLSGGMVIEGASMTYEAGRGTWAFERATVTLPQTPGEDK